MVLAFVGMGQACLLSVMFGDGRSIGLELHLET